ncbi:MAG: hypothetical protein ACXABK_03405 [Candidatus Heimdallarchaeaceae archaeon]|jgi:hypothetical protein
MTTEVCFFCNRDISKIDPNDKYEMPCCEISCHKTELYRWFLKKEKCPNCGSSHTKSIEKIINWGDNRVKERRIDNRLKSKEFKKWTKVRYEKKVRDNRK